MKRETIVCLIPVLIMVHALIRIPPSNVSVLINGMVQRVINMIFVVQTHVNMEGSVKLLEVTINVIVYMDGQGRIVKDVIIAIVRCV